MNKLTFAGAAALLLAGSALAQDGRFTPGKLAVLRAGDGELSLSLRQAPIFVDQYDPATPGAAPSFTVRIPTNGPNAFFFNGHAATEGLLTRSLDHKLLAFAGYGGVDLLKESGTAARLEIQRGMCTVDAAGTVHAYLYKSDTANVKMNPRGVATDGTNNFWGCGNSKGTFYFNPIAQTEPVRFDGFPNSRGVRIIDNILYASMNEADAYAAGQSAGVYNFLPAALPHAANAQPTLVIASAPAFKRVAAFEIGPGGNTAYMADAAAGIQKYVKTGGDWKFAYNIAIPQNIPKDLNNAAGCFGLVVDFSGAAPILYATTTEGYGDAVNSNRVVRIVDTNANAVVTTLVQAGSTNIAFRGVEFTPN